ncbi:MAG: 1,4-alpha-glucan branching protein GlgB [Planctomycetota bacterium]|jgi:1,4-alpha-glucan branching enzyme
MASGIPEKDLYLFNRGELTRAWRWLGAHLVEGGVRFAVWAPYAKEVSVAGDFDDWKGYPLEERGTTGVWEGVVAGAGKGQHYKYVLIDSTGKRREKADPFAFRMELRPKTGSVIWPLGGHTWGDSEWMAARAETQAPDRPLSIYEVHVGSWRRGKTFRDLARELVDYAVSMNFTHVELLPIAEYPYDGSWGYQVCGHYAVTRRFGSPQDLMFLVDACHRRGLGVLLDWVPAHFPKDEHGLNTFDGSHLYEHEDPRRGLHKDWDTLIFNYGRPEVKNFLVSNALFWLDEFHIDGLRVDAVTSMLYLDYSREEGEWVPNEEGGNIDNDALAFLKAVNDLAHDEAPGALMIAEESATFPGITTPTEHDGVGFDLKWNMGWMHDSLDFLEKDPVYRKFHHDQLTFALWYAFKERYVLPLSHDEVVHLKKSLLDKMPGDAWRRHANLRLLHAWQAAHPGKSLLFMGGELGQETEWDHDAELPWELLDKPDHAGLKQLVRELNGMVREHACLHEADFDWRGFEWIDFSDVERTVITFLRWDAERATGMLWAFNFTPVVQSDYQVGVPRPGRYTELINTDAACYGGSNVGNLGAAKATEEPCQERDYAIRITLPPLAAVAFMLPPAPATKES